MTTKRAAPSMRRGMRPERAVRQISSALSYGVSWMFLKPIIMIRYKTSNPKGAEPDRG